MMDLFVHVDGVAHPAILVAAHGIGRLLVLARGDDIALGAVRVACRIECMGRAVACRALDAGVKIDISTEETEWPSFYEIYVPVE